MIWFLQNIAFCNICNFFASTGISIHADHTRRANPLYVYPDDQKVRVEVHQVHNVHALISQNREIKPVGSPSTDTALSCRKNPKKSTRSVVMSIA